MTREYDLGERVPLVIEHSSGGRTAIFNIKTIAHAAKVAREGTATFIKMFKKGGNDSPYESVIEVGGETGYRDTIFKNGEPLE